MLNAVLMLIDHILSAVIVVLFTSTIQHTLYKLSGVCLTLSMATLFLLGVSILMSRIYMPIFNNYIISRGNRESNR
jgi:hypothetical protein